MNEKEISEIRRRFRPDRSGISHIRGCYVNENREIVSQFDQSLGLDVPGGVGKAAGHPPAHPVRHPGQKLADITFSTQQVVDSEEHRLLMALRGSSLADEEAVQALFQRVISSLTLEGKLSHPPGPRHLRRPLPGQRRGADGRRLRPGVSYILCSICPVKLTKPALSYFVYENAFHDLKADWVVSPPEAGFLFPALTSAPTNLYNALYYSRDIGENHPELIDALFRTPLPCLPPSRRRPLSPSWGRRWRRIAAITCPGRPQPAAGHDRRAQGQQGGAAPPALQGEVRSVLSPAAWPPPMWMPLRPSMTRPSARRPA
ncbi:hypothetical protein LAWASA_4478 [Lawsonibacter asaccharolyticus]|nr:hypothetical protein LAWASA_4478 [Lawsonibacter asaccharolyticus]